MANKKISQLTLGTPGTTDVLPFTQGSATFKGTFASLPISTATQAALDAKGVGTVTTMSVVTANGVSGSVATASTTPAITLTLGAITPTSVASSGAVSGTSFSTTGGLELGDPDTSITRVSAGKIAVEGVNVVTVSSTDTMTNKRITRRAPAITQSATPTINTDVTDVAHITGLAQAITSMTTNLSGTPVEGDVLRIDITDDGTARAITWGASFEASGNVPLPTTTVTSTRLDVGFVWNTVTSKWRCVATA